MTSQERADELAVVWFESAGPGTLPGLSDAVRAAIDDAVAEERKRIHDEIVQIIRERRGTCKGV